MIAELLAAFFFMTTLSGVFTTWLWRERAINFEQQIYKLITERLEVGKWLARQIRSTCGQYNDDEQPVVLCVAQMRERIAELEAHQVPGAIQDAGLVPKDIFYSGISPYMRGWNDCREAMLAAAPEGEE